MSNEKLRKMWKIDKKGVHIEEWVKPKVIQGTNEPKKAGN